MLTMMMLASKPIHISTMRPPASLPLLRLVLANLSVLSVAVVQCPPPLRQVHNCRQPVHLAEFVMQSQHPLSQPPGSWCFVALSVLEPASSRIDQDPCSTSRQASSPR